MAKAATSQWAQSQRQAAFRQGREDGLMKRAQANPFAVGHVGHAPYVSGYRAGLQHRKFLQDRGMRHVISSVARFVPGQWAWSVWVEGRLHAMGTARSAKQARQAAEAVGLEAALEHANG